MKPESANSSHASNEASTSVIDSRFAATEAEKNQLEVYF